MPLVGGFAASTEADHIVPIRAGGAKYDMANGQGACKPCHARKTAIEDSSFTRSRYRGRSNLLAAIDIYAKTAGARNAQRLRAFVLLLKYSGMRIGDTVQCGVDRIEENRLFLYTQKTDTPVYCVLPDFVVKALGAAPRTSERFYLWSGASMLHSAVGKWQR